MDFGVVISLVSGILIIAGVGWKLHAELSKIRIMIEVFMATATEKWKVIDKIESDVHEISVIVNSNTNSISLIKAQQEIKDQQSTHH